MHDIEQHIPDDTTSLLPCSTSGAVTRKKYKAMIHVQYMKLYSKKRQRGDNNQEDNDDDAPLSIVYRIGWNYHHQEGGGGGGGPATTTALEVVDDDKLFCIQFINKNVDVIYDYYDNVDDMDVAIGSHCGSSTFQRAHKLVMRRISKGAGDEKGLLALITSIRGHSSTTPSSSSPATRKKKNTTKDRIKHEEMEEMTMIVSETIWGLAKKDKGADNLAKL